MPHRLLQRKGEQRVALQQLLQYLDVLPVAADLEVGAALEVGEDGDEAVAPVTPSSMRWPLCP